MRKPPMSQISHGPKEPLGCRQKAGSGPLGDPARHRDRFRVPIVLWPRIALLTILPALAIWSGCPGAAYVEPGAVKADVSAPVTIAGLSAQIERLEAQVNTTDSWTSVVLAASMGFSVVVTALGIALYLLIHRVPVLRHLADAMKGKPVR